MNIITPLLGIAILLLAGCSIHKRTVQKYSEKNITHTPEVVKKPIKILNVQELRVAFDYFKRTTDRHKQIACLERMMVLSTDNQEIEHCILWLGDLYAQQAQHHKAQLQYERYLTLYPASAQVAYAHMRLIDTYFATTLAADRDQTSTRSTLEYAQSYLLKSKDNKAYQRYQNYILSIIKQCAQKLVDHELLIIDFYRHQGNTTAAQARFKASREQIHNLSLLVGDEYNDQLQKLEHELASD